MSGMRSNPRRKGSERAGSRPLETNVLSSINEYMECVLSLSRSCLFWFFGYWDPNRQRTYRVKILSLFWNHPR